MEAKDAKAWLWRIIRQRERLNRTGKTRLNPLVMANICQKLRRQLEAFPYKGNSIYRFIQINYVSILLIIPRNSALKKNSEKLLQLWQTAE